MKGARPALVVLALVVILSSCFTSTEDDDTTSTFVVIDQITVGGNDASYLNSDVCGTLLDTSPTIVCQVVNDDATVTMRAQVKDQGRGVDSFINAITFDRYRVTFVRSDNRNTPGVDVPYPFDGIANFRVTPDGNQVDHLFVVVRHQAKLESPLRELSVNGAGLIISTIAEVEFFGRDGAGRALTAKGFVSVNFADFP